MDEPAVHCELFGICDSLSLLCCYDVVFINLLFCPTGLRHIMYIARFAEGYEIKNTPYFLETFNLDLEKFFSTFTVRNC